MTTNVTGPITGGAHGWPFSLPLTDLDAVGYVAEEFFLDGSATGYEAEPGTEFGPSGQWHVRAARTAPYRTRMLVVRPRDTDAFNGIVHLNWQNVTAGFEIGTADSDLLLDGFAWVGVSAQRVGVVGLPGMEQLALAGWDPERYGTLEHPGDDFSFDIYTQAARAIGPETLGGLVPRLRVASGGSQSAMRLRAYANAVQPLERAFDAFFLFVDFGKGSLPDTSSVDPAAIPMGILPTVDVQIREDLGVPTLVFNTETEATALYPVRQPDTETLRLWEVAGTCHTGGIASQLAMAPLFERDGIAFALDGSARGMPVPEHPNVLSFTPAHRAAFSHFNTWIDGGAPPPEQERIEFDRTASTDAPVLLAAPGTPAIRRDRYGNALGGIRLPDFAVPTGQHTGIGEGEALAALVGYSRPFTPEELGELYPSREAYLSRWHAALDHGVEAGFVLADDAPAMKAVADETAATIFPA
jgi:hypothetical protein